MRTRIALLFAALVPFAAGCSSEATGTDDEVGIHGTYTLQTINGAALPFTVQDDAEQKFEVLKGEITLRLDGTFTDLLGYRVTPAGGTASAFDDTLTGRFMHQGDAVFFEADSGGTYDMSVGADGTLSMLVGSFVLAYHR